MNITDILSKPHWRRLRDFVAHWYAKPLGGEAQNLAALQAKEAELGVTFPSILREWYMLVAHRFCDVNQDRAVRLEAQACVDGRFVFWLENQGSWSLEVESGADEADPPARLIGLEGHGVQHPGTTVSEALLGMVVSDTLVGVSSGSRAGPLGPLAHDVVGGWLEEGSGEDASLSELDFWPCPLFAPSRGDTNMIIRDQMLWMAKGPQAEEAALHALGITQTPPYFLVVIRFSHLPETAVDDALFLSEPGALQSGRLCSTWRTQHDEHIEFELETQEPEAVLAEVTARLDPLVARHMEAGFRPPHLAKFTPCFPADANEFARHRRG